MSVSVKRDLWSMSVIVKRDRFRAGQAHKRARD
jgi:hypothetical protein